jgi:hypothetical protein
MAEETAKYDRRGKSKNPNKLRNLPQYRDLDDNEFQKAILAMQKKDFGISNPELLQKRITEKLDMFEEDYDLTDLKINDREVLNGLIQAIIAVEDYDVELFKARSEGVNAENLILVEKLQRARSDLVKSISDMQNDLAITRKHRRSDQETSVIAYIESLKDKARKFYKERMSYVFCPKCNTLLSTIWTLYPETNNKLTLTCLQKDKDGNECNTTFTVTTKELLKDRGTNKKSIMPESML